VALPELIEIVPRHEPVQAEVTVPGSKSITNRALILAALAEGETTLRGALWSEDTQVMIGALGKLGFRARVEPDLREAGNRTITVQGQGGTVVPGGTTRAPLDLFVGNAGTAARFLSAMVCLGRGVYRLRGVERMHERPQAALFTALRELGYRVDSPNDRLPALIHGAGPKAGQCRVSIEESSQFASALILCSARGGWRLEITGENAEESPYVKLTEKMLETFPPRGGTFLIEPDASSGSYFWGAHWLLNRSCQDFFQDPPNHSRVTVRRWPESAWQIDQQFPALVALRAEPSLPASISRTSSLGDSIMTAIVLAPFSTEPVRFTDLGRLRLQECERVAALRTELSRCGARVEEQGDTLTVFPSELHGAEIETYHDHRMAMCFAILGLKIPGITLKNPACVKKTFPNFFQKLAALPPDGLGVEIHDARSGRILAGDSLFAE
jgi:3-phosphoshikimate 1-carboxyvinyltransferase